MAMTPSDQDKRVRAATADAVLRQRRGKPQYRHAPAASMAVRKIIRPLAKAYGPGTSILSDNWLDFAGPQLGALSRPVALRGSGRQRVLHIEAKGPAASLIEASSGQILGRINRFMGAGTVTELRVRQGFPRSERRDSASTRKRQPEHERPPSAEISEPETVAEALRQLGLKIGLDKNPKLRE